MPLDPFGPRGLSNSSHTMNVTVLVLPENGRQRTRLSIQSRTASDRTVFGIKPPKIRGPCIGEPTERHTLKFGSRDRYMDKDKKIMSGRTWLHTGGQMVPSFWIMRESEV